MNIILTYPSYRFMRVFFAAFLFTLTFTLARGGEAYTPAKGSQERTELIEIQRKLPKEKAVFVVKHMRIQDEWACTLLVPTDPKTGETIVDPTWRIFQRVGGKWRELDYESKVSSRSGDEELDLMGMSPAAVTRILKVFPQVPRGIFPFENF